jgi:hypothetical protein
MDGALLMSMGLFASLALAGLLSERKSSTSSMDPKSWANTLRLRLLVEGEGTVAGSEEGVAASTEVEVEPKSGTNAETGAEAEAEAEVGGRSRTLAMGAVAGIAIAE